MTDILQLNTVAVSAAEPVATLPAFVASISDLDAFRHGPWGAPAPGYPENMRSLWSPYDYVHEALLALINSAKRELVVAMFGFTDLELGAAIEAKLNDPNIVCEVTLDRTQAAGPTEKKMLDTLGMLNSNSVVVGSSEHGSIMHRKVLIIDRRWLVTGSTNFSLDAERKQDNHLVVIDSPVAAAEAGITLHLEHVKALTKAGR